MDLKKISAHTRKNKNSRRFCAKERLLKVNKLLHVILIVKRKYGNCMHTLREEHNWIWKDVCIIAFWKC